MVVRGSPLYSPHHNEMSVNSFLKWNASTFHPMPYLNGMHPPSIQLISPYAPHPCHHHPAITIRNPSYHPQPFSRPRQRIMHSPASVATANVPDQIGIVNHKRKREKPVDVIRDVLLPRAATRAFASHPRTVVEKVPKVRHLTSDAFGLERKFVQQPSVWLQVGASVFAWV